MHYEGKIYRPWMESESLIIQVTIGCSNNKCTFCDMFRDKQFRIRSIEGVYADIEEARTRYSKVRSIFLVDGNVMAIKTELLLNILNKIAELFPECENISLYAQFNDIRRKSVEELKSLKAAGLSIAYVGLETGDTETLIRVKKGMTREQAIEGMEKAREAGIEVLVSIIFGLAGKKDSERHIKETVTLLNQLRPHQIAPMALTVQPGTPLAEQVESGEFIQATPRQILEEEKYLLENIDFPTYYWGDHGNNIISVRGYYPENKVNFLEEINYALEHHPALKNEILYTQPW